MTARGPLHVRPDEEPDIDFGHFIDRSVYMYSGCRFCGQETHAYKDCPHRPQAAETAPEHT